MGGNLHFLPSCEIFSLCLEGGIHGEPEEALVFFRRRYPRGARQYRIILVGGTHEGADSIWIVFSLGGTDGGRQYLSQIFFLKKTEKAKKGSLNHQKHRKTNTDQEKQIKSKR